MPKPLTLYKDGKVQGDVYPDELKGWEAMGWSLSPSQSTQSTQQDKAPAKEPEPTKPNLLNINEASADEISEALDGIGESRANKIIEKRESLDVGFTDMEQIPFLTAAHKKLIDLGGE